MILKVIFTVLIVSVVHSNALTPDQISQIDKVVQDEIMANNKVPGLGLTVVENFGQSTYSRGYGHSDIETGRLVTKSTQFFVGSITKTMTATIVAKVLSESFPQLGALAMETPLRKLISNGNFTFSDRFRDETMSFRDLLSHRHGIQSDRFGIMAGVYSDLDEYVYRSRYSPEAGPFRATFTYSNSMLSLAANSIAEIANKPFNTLLQEFLDELGMTSSSMMEVDENLEEMRGLSKGYFLKEGIITPYNTSLFNRVAVAGPAGAVISTPEDIGKYMTFHLNMGRVGDKQLIPEEAMMWLRYPALAYPAILFKSPQYPTVSGAYAFGTNFLLAVHDGWHVLNHGGHWMSFLSDMRIYPDAGFASFATINGPIDINNNGPYSHVYLQNSIFDIAHDIQRSPSEMEKLLNHKVPENAKQFLPKHLPNAVNLTQESLLGVFGHPVEGVFEISNPNGTLYIRYGKWATGYLHPYADVLNTFTIRWDSDFIQDVYYGGGGSNTEPFIQFIDSDTVSLFLVDIFLRDQTIDVLPTIPWAPDSCAPHT